MIKAVLDTNVLVSAMLRPLGKPAQIIDQQPSRFELFLSESILDETWEVLQRKRIQKKDPITKQAIEAFFVRLRNASIMVIVVAVENIITEDPPDNVVLACAVQSNADYLVSGNLHFLNLKEHRNVKMVTPAQFLEILKTLADNSQGEEFV